MLDKPSDYLIDEADGDVQKYLRDLEEALVVKNKMMFVHDRQQQHFIESLSEKTGWGRNEIIAKFQEAQNKALLEAI